MTRLHINVTLAVLLAYKRQRTRGVRTLPASPTEGRDIIMTSPVAEEFSAAPSPLFFLCSSLLLLLLPAAASYLLLFRRPRDSNGRDRHSRHAAAPDPRPPGDEGLPILGETLRLISAYKTEDPEAFMDKRVARHGRVFTSHVFGERTVFSSDPEFNRLVVHSEGKLFEWSYPSSITALLGRHALVLTKGPRHKRMHSLTLASFSSHSALRDHLLPDIDRLVRLNLHSWADGQVLHLLDRAKKITFDMAVKQLLSIEPGEWTEGLRKEYQHLIDGFFSVPIPFFSFTTYGRAIQARRRVAEALRVVVRQRMSVFQQKQQQRQEQQQPEHEKQHEEEDQDKDQQKKQQQEEEEEHRPKRIREADMLETLLVEGMTEEEQVVDFLLALLVAGYDTTSTSMTLAVKYLSESPAALAALTEEHEGILRKREEEEEAESGNGLPCSKELRWTEYKNSLPFTHCVINETLRMGNIVSGVFRRATVDIPVKGYTIPKGCKVFASFRAVHLDSDYYDDARTFNPWRWQQKPQQEQQSLPLQQLQQTKKQQQTIGSSSSGVNVFTPFGGGTRLCPGYELARVELAVFLHHLVTTLSWEAAEEDRLVFFPTTRTLKGYPIRVHHRRSAAGASIHV